MLTIKSINGNPIKNLDDWFNLASPQGGEKQWKDCRSAKELARYILTYRGEIPPVISLALDCFPYSPEDLKGIPEYVSALPGKGIGRNHDLFIFNDNIVIGIEAKADEPFGQLVKKWIPKPDDSRYSNKRRRIDKLCRLLFNENYSEEKYGSLHYQLIQALGSTLLETQHRNIDKALFITLVFNSKANDKAKMTYNDKAYHEFADKLNLSILKNPTGLDFVGWFMNKKIKTYIIKATINI